MVEVISGIVGFMEEFYQGYVAAIAEFPILHEVVKVCLLSAFIILSFIFIWRFYKMLSHKDLIKLDLRKYNFYEHALRRKIFAMFLYMVEYVFLVPFFIILWAAGLAIFVLLLSEGSVGYIVVLVGAMIISIRVLAYFKESLAQDLAQLFPIVTLATFLVSPNLLDVGRIFNQLNTLPNLLGTIVYYFMIIFVVEIALRFSEEAFQFSKSEESRAKLVNAEAELQEA